MVGCSFLPIWSAISVAGDGQVVIAKGLRGVQHWITWAEPDAGRKGICLQIEVYRVPPLDGTTGSGRCAAPAAGRGIIVASVEPNYVEGRPLMTAVGLAFQKRVSKIEVFGADGSAEVIRPHTPKHKQNGGAQVDNYRYAGFSVRGPWCIDQIVTFDRRGDSLWRADWKELARFFRLPYDFFLVCEKK